MYMYITNRQKYRHYRCKDALMDNVHPVLALKSPEKTSLCL